MITSFRDDWLYKFYMTGRNAGPIPASIVGALQRKLDIIDAAVSEADLRVPPGNRIEHLGGNLSHLCSIRVNRQYRLIEIYLDPHAYR